MNIPRLDLYYHIVEKVTAADFNQLENSDNEITGTTLMSFQRINLDLHVQFSEDFSNHRRHFLPGQPIQTAADAWHRQASNLLVFAEFSHRF